VGNLRAFTVALVAAWPFVLLAIGVIMMLNWLRKRRKKAAEKETAGLSSK
jgi:cytochrome c-type biogenesis protein CcmH/NrfF